MPVKNVSRNCHAHTKLTDVSLSPSFWQKFNAICPSDKFFWSHSDLLSLSTKCLIWQCAIFHNLSYSTEWLWKKCHGGIKILTVLDTCNSSLLEAIHFPWREVDTLWGWQLCQRLFWCLCQKRSSLGINYFLSRRPLF